MRGAVLLLGVLVPVCLAGRGAATDIVGIEPAATVVPIYGKFEVRFDLTSAYANPFDPGEVDASLVVRRPSHDTLVVPAFWYQAYQRTSTGTDEILTADGEPCWMARFAPEETGEHIYFIRVIDASGEARSADSVFTATDSSNPGFIRRDPGDSRLFTFSSGDPYLPAGHNVAWATNLGTYDYDMYFGAMATGEETWTRIWMTHFYRGQSLEWSPAHWTGYFHGVGTYSLECAWKLDHIIEAARQQGIGIQLVTQHHGQFSTTVDPCWSENPYNAANGGMLTTPKQFFTNADAKSFYKRKLRYMVARWGYSTSILAWEFWNEVQYTDGYNAATVAAWHAEMGQYLKGIDPWHHLLTTSARENDGVIWSLPEIDCTQLHLYVSEITNTIRNKAMSMWTYSKPVVVGEFGYYPHETGWADTDGTHLHNGIWSAAMAMTGAMCWWWDNYVHPNNLYYHFSALRSFFDGEDLRHPHLGTVNTVVGGNAAARCCAVGDSMCAYLWVQDSNNEIGRIPQDSLAGVWVKIPGMIAGDYGVEFWNTYTGVCASTAAIWCAGDTLLVGVPAFRWDTAIKVKHSAAAGARRTGPQPGERGHAVVISPNPCRNGDALLTPRSASRPVEILLSDVRGRVVWRTVTAEAAVRWTGTNLAGEAVPAGMYFCTVAGGGRAGSTKMVVIR